MRRRLAGDELAQRGEYRRPGDLCHGRFLAPSHSLEGVLVGAGEANYEARAAFAHAGNHYTKIFGCHALSA